MRSSILTIAALLATAAISLGLLRAGAEELPAFPVPGEGQAVYAVDAAHTSLVFSIFRAGLNNVYGLFGEKSGRILVDEANPANSYVEFTVNMASVDTGVAARDDHLRTADFFDVEKFATATFRSTSVTPHSPTGMRVDGVLTFMGISRPLGVELQITGPLDGKRGRSLGFDTSFSFLRSDFGVPRSEGQADEVFLTLSGAAVLEQPEAEQPAS